MQNEFSTQYPLKHKPKTRPRAFSKFRIVSGDLTAYKKPTTYKARKW